MNFFRIRKEDLLHILINRTVIFFFLACLLTLFIYAAGTVQNFIDSTQLYLLKLYSVLGIFLTVSSGLGIILDTGRFVRIKEARSLIRAVVYVFLALFGAATVLTVVFIISLSGGNS
jgi:membrane-associated PAP2 superfamily phosphatase